MISKSNSQINYYIQNKQAENSDIGLSDNKSETDQSKSQINNNASSNQILNKVKDDDLNAITRHRKYHNKNVISNQNHQKNTIKENILNFGNDQCNQNQLSISQIENQNSKNYFSIDPSEFNCQYQNNKQNKENNNNQEKEFSVTQTDNSVKNSQHYDETSVSQSQNKNDYIKNKRNDNEIFELSNQIIDTDNQVKSTEKQQSQQMYLNHKDNGQNPSFQLTYQSDDQNFDNENINEGENKIENQHQVITSDHNTNYNSTQIQGGMKNSQNNNYTFDTQNFDSNGRDFSNFIQDEDMSNQQFNHS